MPAIMPEDGSDHAGAYAGETTRRVLVTGAAGFVGRAALAAVPPSWEIHGCGRRPRPADLPARVAWHVADLADGRGREELLRATRPSHLLHLAWCSKHGEFWRSPENLRWVEASLHLIRCFQELGGRRVVCAGTCAEYDWSAGTCSERVTPLLPASPYGVCKDALRRVVESHAELSGLRWGWGRVFFMYGPGEQPTRLVPSVIRALLEGRPARCSGGEQRRDFSHVGDVGAALVHLLASDLQGPVNVASGRAVAVREVVSLIGELIGRPDLLEFDDSPPRGDEPRVLAADTTRLTRELGWQPRFGLREGLADTIRYHRDHPG
jgi:nucleoside-diphosphate-sugar epimerase